MFKNPLNLTAKEYEKLQSECFFAGNIFVKDNQFFSTDRCFAAWSGNINNLLINTTDFDCVYDYKVNKTINTYKINFNVIKDSFCYLYDIGTIYMSKEFKTILKAMINLIKVDNYNNSLRAVKLLFNDKDLYINFGKELFGSQYNNIIDCSFRFDLNDFNIDFTNKDFNINRLDLLTNFKVGSVVQIKAKLDKNKNIDKLFFLDINQELNYLITKLI